LEQLQMQMTNVVRLGRSLLLTPVLVVVAVLSGCGETDATASTASTSATSTTGTASTTRTTGNVSTALTAKPTSTIGIARTAGATSTTSTTSTTSAASTTGTGSSASATAAIPLSTNRKTVNPLGVNLEAVSYYSSEQPFLNLMKDAGASSALSGATGWYTANPNTWDTNEEAYLQLDADGYPTSLTASSAISGGQQFTYVKTLLDYNQLKGAPGQTYPYPPGTYRLKFEGQGTVQLAGDASYVSGDTCSSSLALSNSNPNSYVSCTFTVSNPGSNAGILLEITAITNGTDHPRDISVVQNAYASNYDAGAIFNPQFLSALSGFSSLRFMDWMQTNYEFSGYAASASLLSGATSLTLPSAWTLPSGSYPVVFIDGEQRTATFTLGSTSVSWSGGLANMVSEAGDWQMGSQSYGAAFYLVNKTWANRSRPSNAFWGLQAGVPLEVMVALCNQLSANCHLNVPMMYSDADIKAMGQMVMSGTNMQSGYSALSASQTASFELSNEVWNSIYPQYGVAGSLGGILWPAATSGGGNFQWNRNFLGMRTAQMASDLQAAVGTSLFTRVIPVLAAQAANAWTATYALQTPYWSGGPASNYPIKAIAIAPYWGSNPSSGDCGAMTSQSDGGLADFFATLNGQTGASGHVYSSVPPNGYLGQVEAYIASYAAILPNYPSMSLIAYEGGQNFYATTSGTCSGWTTLVTAAERDARMGTAYTTYLNYWQSKAGSSSQNINNLYNDFDPISGYGAWGLMETVMQSFEPLTAAPAKYQAAINYLQ
jgi:hypothetical protein